MPKTNPKAEDPERYKQVKEQQQALFNQCNTKMTMARICPYCRHRIAIVFSGTHSFTQDKCPNCGEDVIFPPVCFKLA